MPWDYCYATQHGHPMRDTRRSDHVHLHDGAKVGIWALYRRYGPRYERLGTYCPICSFVPSPRLAAQLRSEALDAIAEAKRAKLDAPTPTKRAKRAKVRPFFTP